MNARHDPILLAVALAIAVLASYVALDFAGRVRRARGRTRALWWLTGLIGLIAGIWSLQFIVRLALLGASSLEYDVPLVLLTVFVAIAASALAINVRSRPVLPVYALVMGSLLMGAAISGMHYTDLRLATTAGTAVEHLEQGLSLFSQGISVALIPGTLLLVGLALTIAAIDARERLLTREQQVRHDIEQASRIKDEFLATLSHELRTPLNVILGRTQMLHGAAHDESRVRELTAAIERNGAALAKLVEDLLDVSRITLGHVRLDTQPVRITDLLTIAAQGIQPSAQVKNITLTVKSTVPGLVIGDPTRLQQIIWNLLVNAIKFTPPHGRVDAAVVSEAGRIVLTVSDSGCGIHPSFLPHVFEPFRQAESTTSGLSGGLGIGLSIVRQLIELHGGTITAESAGTGLGSAFIVSLPAAREELLTFDERVPVAAISA